LQGINTKQPEVGGGGGCNGKGKHESQKKKRVITFQGILLRLQEAYLWIEIMLQDFSYFDANPDPDPTTWRSGSICFSENFPYFSKSEKCNSKCETLFHPHINKLTVFMAAFG
jgi:hypothetical protein